MSDSSDSSYSDIDCDDAMLLQRHAFAAGRDDGFGADAASRLLGASPDVSAFLALSQ